MKNKRHLYPLALTLGLGLGMTFASCSDNDLDGSNKGNDSDNTELTDQEWQKQITLQCLLGAIANVDSLPSNWNDASYTVTPSIGTPQSDATPYAVRLVPTNSVDEAYREYRSMISAGCTSSATDEKWSMDGIGSLNFKKGNGTDTYATLDVNIKQLPLLQQIRFVSPDVIGNNDGDVQAAYYSFGDIIRENSTGIYWICVRPVSKKNSLGKSHWCSFQLEADGKNANFKKVENTLTLPTNLGLNQAEGQRMTQNLFNLLRIINQPSIYDGVETFDKIPSTEFEQSDVSTLGYIWDDENYWKLIAPKFYTQVEGVADEAKTLQEKIDKFKERFTEQNAINALYYGYTRKYSIFGQNSYKVYNLSMNIDNEGAFYTSTPETPSVEWSKTSSKDLSQIYENPGENSYKLLGDNYDNVFIVKHRTGAQLQGRIMSTLNDDKPSVSFNTSAPSKGFEDIFVYNRDKGTYVGADNFYPFFSFGDQVTKPMDGTFAKNEVHICIKPANNAYTVKPGDGENAEAKEARNDAFFISTNSSPQKIGKKVEVEEAQYIALQILRCIASTKNSYLLPNKNYETIEDFDKSTTNAIGYAFKDNAAINNYQCTGKDKDLCYSIDVNFYMEGSTVEPYTGKVTKAKTIHIEYYPNKADDNKYFFKVRTAVTNPEDFIPLYKYQDLYKYQELYGSEHVLYSKGNNRLFYKANILDNLDFHELEMGEPDPVN